MFPRFNIPKGYETRMRITRSMIARAATKSLDSITVAEICTEADISRQTFYRYFSDKYDVANWYDLLIGGESLAQIGRTLTWFEGHLKKLMFCREERDFYMIALRSNDHCAVHRNVIRYTNAEYRRTVEEINSIAVTPELEFQISVQSRIAAETATEWILNGMKTAPQQLAKWQDACIPGDLYAAMNDPVRERRNDESRPGATEPSTRAQTRR
jgi:AcrR family transcriptional regulator